MADRQKGIGVIISHNKEKAKIVTPISPSQTITKRLERYDVDANTFTQLADMTFGRLGHSLHEYDDCLFVVGGTDGSKVHTSVEKYTISTDEWETVEDMPLARMYFQSVLVNDNIYCIGGLTSSALGTISFVSKVHVYNTTTDTWSELESLPDGYEIVMGIAHHVAGKIYVLSGYRNTFGTYNEAILTYDISLDQWSTNEALTVLGLSLYRRLLPFSFVRGTDIYVIDGLYYTIPDSLYDDEGNVIKTYDPIVQYLPSSYRFDCTSGTVSYGDIYFDDLPRARYAGATASIDDVHYFIGGINDFSNTLRFIESSNGSFSPFEYTDVGRLLKGRSSLAVAGYGDEYSAMIFISGGLNSIQDNKFLKIDLSPAAVPPVPPGSTESSKSVFLNGKQTAALNITVTDENGEYPGSVLIHLLCSSMDEQNKTVLFADDSINVINGQATATLLPRSDDLPGVMNTGVVRSYPLSITASVIDSSYYGDTQSVATETTSVIDSQSTPTNFAQVTLPSQFGKPIVYDTVISSEYTTPGSFIDLTSLAGFISFIPTINQGGEAAEITYKSDIDWLPQSIAHADINGASYSDMYELLSRLEPEIPMGGSALLDGIAKASDIMKFDSSANNKVIHILTDGQENSSFYSKSETLTLVNLIKGSAKVPLVVTNLTTVPEALYLDQGNRTGSPDMEYVAQSTGGSVTYVISDTELSDTIVTLMKARGFLGYGSFSFEHDLGEDTIIESICLNFDIPDSTSAMWSYSIGDDNRLFSPLTEKISPNETVSLNYAHGRYLRFVVEFEATVESDAYLATPISPPKLTSVDIVYHAKKETFIYLEPQATISDPHQVLLTLDANRPLGSEILFGATDGISGLWSDYDTPASPAMENGSRVVFPIRKTLGDVSNTLEPLISVDGFVFNATYGPWPQNATVAIYLDGTTLVDPLDYQVVPQKGRVIFGYKTSDSYVISITTQPSIALGIRIINRLAGDPVVISGAGYMYSTMRVAQTNDALSKVVPSAQNVLLTPMTPTVDSVFKANYLYTDLKGREEKDTRFAWYINNVVQSDLTNLQEWDNKHYNLAKVGDTIYVVIEPMANNGTSLTAGAKTRSLPVMVA